MQASLEPDLARLLNDLLSIQGRLLKLLGAKRDMLLRTDAEGLQALVPEEERLVEELQACVRRREQMLRTAAEEGVRCRDLRGLAKTLPRKDRQRVESQLQQATGQAQLLKHESLVNWVVIQRTLLHLSQLLEIIATGGRLQPTYGKGDPVGSTGGLVDRAA